MIQPIHLSFHSYRNRSRLKKKTRSVVKGWKIGKFEAAAAAVKSRDVEATDDQEAERDKRIISTEVDLEGGKGVGLGGERKAESGAGQRGEGEADQEDERGVDRGEDTGVDQRGGTGAGPEEGGEADHGGGRKVDQRTEGKVVQRKGTGAHHVDERKAVIRKGHVVDQEAKKEGKRLTNLVVFTLCTFFFSSVYDYYASLDQISDVGVGKACMVHAYIILCTYILF